MTPDVIHKKRWAILAVLSLSVFLVVVICASRAESWASEAASVAWA